MSEGADEVERLRADRDELMEMLKEMIQAAIRENAGLTEK